MDVADKLDILSRDAQYDLSCACGTKNPAEHRQRGRGDSWLYPVTVANGGTGIMLKTLMTNSCSNDCLYCPLRNDSDTRRVGLKPDELAAFFMQLQAKRPLIGIFLSSGVMGSPDNTMDRLVSTAEILRRHYRYKGYIHLKIIPGSSKAAIDKALSLSSAVSLNIETPGAAHFSKLSLRKRYEEDIIAPLRYISEQTAKGAAHAKVCKTSQFIVGASDESDKEILAYSWGMYRRLGFDRLYYSAYQSGLGDPSLPGERRSLALQEQTDDTGLFPVPIVLPGNSLLVREHRLYQTDFLFRRYGFTYDDIPFNADGNLDMSKDPKQLWADAHPEFYPVSLNKASKEQLLRVPGVGPAWADRIVKARSGLSIHSLDALRVPDHLYQKASAYVCR